MTSYDFSIFHFAHRIRITPSSPYCDKNITPEVKKKLSHIFFDNQRIMNENAEKISQKYHTDITLFYSMSVVSCRFVFSDYLAGISDLFLAAKNVPVCGVMTRLQQRLTAAL